MRVNGQIGSRDGKRVQDNLGDLTAGQPRAEDVAELVNRLHGEPGCEEGGDDQDNLMQAITEIRNRYPPGVSPSLLKRSLRFGQYLQAFRG